MGERKATDAEQRPDRLQTLLNALPAGVVLLDAGGRVQEANPAAVELLGEPLQGELWRDVVGRAIDQTAGGGQDIALKNGRLITLSTCPLGSEPGQILLLHDVTETRLLQARLGQHQRLADMGRMAAGLAHQIRTPVASALLYAGHLKNSGLAPEKRTRFAEKVVASLRNLERLVNDMLVFSRGGMSGEEEADVAELLGEAFASLEEQLRQSETQCRIIDECRGAVIRGNRGILISAIQNLMTNAMQAMGRGGRMDLSIRAAPADGVDIEVQDFGPGIPEELLARVFEPFVTSRSAGTGLGLAVVRAVARAHHGEVWVDSKSGEGCRFVIRLPLFRTAVGTEVPRAVAV